MRIIDISRPLDHSTPHWPGDTPFSFELPVKRTSGRGINVGAFRASTHFATHVDAPFHFMDSGETIDQLELGIYYGDAIVIDARGTSIIGANLLPNKLPERVLFRTDAWFPSTQFPSSVPVLSQETVNKLQANNVRLVGIDVPSVDELDSKSLPIHRALLQAGVYILESLQLEYVEPGNYLLCAFPLRLVGADGSPVRAVLVQTSSVKRLSQ
jgi:arylformamidase